MRYLFSVLASLFFVPLYAYATVPNEMVGNWCLRFSGDKDFRINSYRSEILIKADGSFITTVQVINGPVVELKGQWIDFKENAFTSVFEDKDITGGRHTYLIKDDVIIIYSDDGSYEILNRCLYLSKHFEKINFKHI